MTVSRQFRPRLTENEVIYILHFIEAEQEVLDILTPKAFKPGDEDYKYMHRRAKIILKFLHRKFSRLFHDGQHAKRSMITKLCEVSIPNIIASHKKRTRHD